MQWKSARSDVDVSVRGREELAYLSAAEEAIYQLPELRLGTATSTSFLDLVVFRLSTSKSQLSCHFFL